LKSDEHVFDCSKDLFSVTFDLGFCNPDSDDEIVEEHALDTNNSRCPDDLSGRYFDIKEIRKTNYVSNKPRDHVENVTSGTIPILAREDMQSSNFVHFPKNKEFMSPCFSQFSSPVGEKFMSTPLLRSNTLNSVSKIRKEMLNVPDFSEEKVNLQSFKETLNLNFDDSGFSLEKSESYEQIYLQQSHHRSAEGKIPPL
jgi:Fanconi anemia group M protein